MNWKSILGRWRKPPGLSASQLAEIRASMEPFLLPTRKLVLRDGDPGSLPVTKLGGVPWWPAGRGRPICPRGHRMAFIAQVRMSDVPGYEVEGSSLLSFHYCQNCSFEGHMPWGWTQPENPAYDVSLLSATPDTPNDGLGIVADSPIKPSGVQWREIPEIPTLDDLPADIAQTVPSERNYWEASGGFVEDTAFQGLRQVQSSKLGGWPTWRQCAEWPSERSERMRFVAQFDWVVGENTTWGGGGYAYLFATPPGRPNPRGEMAVQTT